MHHENVDIFDVQVAEGVGERHGGVVVPDAPEFGYHCDFTSGDTRSADGGTDDSLDAIVLGGVDKAVASVEGIDNRGLQGIVFRSSKLSLRGCW